MVIKKLYAGFAVDDLAKAEDFYKQALELEVRTEGEGPIRHLVLPAPNGGMIEIYQKPDFVPATFTVLNIVVDNIDEAVDSLAAKGVEFEKYEGMDQDEKGIIRSKGPGQGPSIAWFKDPAGNVFAVLQVVSG